MGMHCYRAPRKTNVFHALCRGFKEGFRHWRLVLLGWLAGLVPAALVGMQVSRLFNAALRHQPDAESIAAGNDIAPLAEALMTMNEGARAGSIAMIGSATMAALALSLLLMPLLSGMLVASLRSGRVLGFGELWAGGWHEYGRQFRLLLVALIPMIAVTVLMSLAMAWAMHGAEKQVLESVTQQRRLIATVIVAVLALLAWIGIEAGRAAFAADTMLRSAFRAWLRGLHLMVKRPLAVLLVVIVTLALGTGLAMLLQKPSLSTTVPGVVLLLCAQLAALVLWWTRVARLSALTAITQRPCVKRPKAAPIPGPVSLSAAPAATS